MPALFRPVGAVEHFVRFRDGTTRYLGTATVAPEVEVRPGFLPVMNDLGGRTFPVCRVRDREQHLVSTTLNRFDWDTYKACQGLAPGSSPATLVDTVLTHGVIAEGVSDFELILVYSLAGTAASPADTPAGRRYSSAVLLGSRESSVGSRVMEVACVFECNEAFVPASRAFSLYTEVAALVTAGLPAVE